MLLYLAHPGRPGNIITSPMEVLHSAATSSNVEQKVWLFWIIGNKWLPTFIPMAVTTLSNGPAIVQAGYILSISFRQSTYKKLIVTAVL